MASLPTLLQTPQAGINHPSTALHLLPVHIAYSGPARIANYFPIKSTGNDLYKSYFRGRLLVGVEIALPEGYSGQVWKSNAPSVSNSNSRASTSKSSTKDDTTTTTDYPSTDYSASSPRRSPRKRASTSTIDASSSSTATSNKAGNSIAKGKKKPPPKRQRFAMSPDISPVKETPPSHDATMAFEGALDKAAELLDTSTTVKGDEVEDSESSQEVIVTSPAKERAKLEAEAEIEAEAMQLEEDGNVTLTMTAESTTTTIQAAGETKTSTTVKLERAVTPPPPSSALTSIPSTPMSASSNNLPINIISPQTPRTPKGTAFSSYRQLSEYDEPSAEDATNNERVHERLIQQVGTFDKITIWNPDIELDKGDDCYVRSLTEWTVLTDLIHS